MELTLMKGGKSHNNTQQKNKKLWHRVVTKGSGEEEKWWWMEVVTMGSGAEEGKRWGREVVTMGSGDEGKWWQREVVTKGSGDKGKWWLWEVMTKGSGEDAWMLHAVCCGEEAGARNLVFFCVKWLQPAMKWKVPRVCGGCGWGRLVPSMCFATMVVPVCVVLCVSWRCGCRSHWNGCMNVACHVLGRKPEHETLCFSV